MALRWRRRCRPFWQAYLLWLRADCVDLSAAFAYHTLQSVFPALLIALALASRLLGNDRQLVDRILTFSSEAFPPSALPVFESTLLRFTRQGFGAGLLGAILLVLSASNIYLTLQRGADRLWWNRPFGFEEMGWPRALHRFFALRLKAIALLLLVGLLIVLDQLISNLRFFGSTVMHDWLRSRIPAALLWLGSLSIGVDLTLSLLIGFFTVLLFLWLLPSRRIPLRPLVPAAVLVSLALTVLNLGLGRALVLLGLRFQAYGVVGGVLVLTLWVWFLGAILYYGQCLSVVLARRAAGGRSALLAGDGDRRAGPGWSALLPPDP